MLVNFFKKSVRSVLGEGGSSMLRNIYLVITNYYMDAMLYCKHSTVFKSDCINKIESTLILYYHSVEKGLLFTNTKPLFAKKRIENIHPILALKVIEDSVERSQIRVAYQVMCQYYEFHEQIDIDISEYFTNEQYLHYKSILGSYYSKDFRGAIDFDRFSFYSLKEREFPVFSSTRKSIRDYTGELIPTLTIEKAITLALNTPSVCNRQAAKVYLLDDKIRIDKLLNVQGGLTGYTKNVNQVLILTVDRNYFYSVGERNQFYIDGGMFLMNMLYALHYYGIANCPANWGKTIQEEKHLKGVVSLPECEKIICIVPIGIAKDQFRVTLSQRRKLTEVLKKL